MLRGKLGTRRELRLTATPMKYNARYERSALVSCKNTLSLAGGNDYTS